MANIKDKWEKDQKDLMKDVGDLKELGEECIKLKALEDDIKDLEEQLEGKKAKAKVISYENIPNILAEKGLSEIKLADGSQVTVKRIVNAYLPKEDKIEERKKALEWLRKNDLGDIIKNDILVSFGQGEDNKAVLFAGLAQKNGYEPTQKMTVHNQVLKATFRGRLDDGLEIPAELFNLFVGNQTKIRRK